MKSTLLPLLAVVSLYASEPNYDSFRSLAEHPDVTQVEFMSYKTWIEQEQEDRKFHSTSALENKVSQGFHL